MGMRSYPQGVVVGITSDDQATCLHSTPERAWGGPAMSASPAGPVSSAWHSTKPEEGLSVMSELPTCLHVPLQQPLELCEPVGLSLVFQMKYRAAEAQGLLEACASSSAACSVSGKASLGAAGRPEPPASGSRCPDRHQRCNSYIGTDSGGLGCGSQLWVCRPASCCPQNQTWPLG